VDANLEIQLYQFLGLANFVNPNNIRQKISNTPFKVLQAIYLIARTNHSKGREETYPCKETIAKVAGCGRRKVTEFINSPACSEFCEVIREYDHVNKRFRPNRYILKDWVIQLFMLFWRSGMMKNFKTNFEKWRSEFKKRIYKWLIPLVQKGKTLKEIWNGVMNKLSTKRGLIGAAGNGLIGAGINPTGNKALRENEYTEDPIQKSIGQTVGILRDRFHLREGDIHHFVFREKLANTIQCAKELCSRIDKFDWKPKSFVRALQDLINRKKHGNLELRKTNR